MPPIPSSTVEEQECAVEWLLASVRGQMDKASGEVVNDLISEGEVKQLTGQAGLSQTLRESSPEPINMRKPWVEGPKGKKVSDPVLLPWPKLTRCSTLNCRCGTVAQKTVSPDLNIIAL